MKYKTLTGYLREVTDQTYYMELQDGSFVEVRVGTQDLSKAVNRLIALSVILDAYEGAPPLVTVEQPCYTYVMQAEAARGPLSKKIGIFRLIPWAATDEQEATHQRLVDDAAERVERYFRTYARHIWPDFEVRGYCVRGDDTVNTHPPVFMKPEIDEFIDAGGCGDFVPTYYHAWGGSDRTYCGLAFVGQDRSVTFTNHDCGPITMTHELGHNFGLSHAGLRTVAGIDREYGDESCIMGFHEVRGLHSPHMVWLGLDTDREIKVIDQTAAVWVAPIEMPQYGMHPQESQHIVIQAPGQKKVSLSLRKTKGWPYPQPKGTADDLYLHEISGVKTKLLEPVMQTGDERTLPGGIEVKHHGVSNGSALVAVRYGDDILVPTPPPPLGFPANIPSAYITDGHAGAWFDPDYYGQGLDIHISGDVIGVFWYTFNQKDSSRRYYLGNGKLVPRTDGPGFEPVTIKLFTTKGPATNYTETEAGSAQLYFTSETRGVFNFNTPEHGRGSTEVGPVMLSTDRDSGVYWQPSLPGSGFSIQFFELHGVKRCGAFWYTYGPKPPAPPVGTREEQTQRWYSCEGAEQTDGSYKLTVYEVEGGRWLDLRRALPISVGTALLTRQEFDGRYRFEYNLEDDRAGSYILERVF